MTDIMIDYLMNGVDCMLRAGHFLVL